MPAHRSDDEAEVRGAAVTHLRRMMPDARIIHEINATDFGNRIDVLAVSEEKIVAVEIKSKKDKLNRLPDQIKAMKGVAHFTIAALHEKFLTELDGSYFPPKEARDSISWIYPRMHRPGHAECGEDWLMIDRWKHQNRTLPNDAIHILWKDELRQVCAWNQIGTTSRMTMPYMVDLIRWNCSGKEITRGICRALRERKCIEADPAIPHDSIKVSKTASGDLFQPATTQEPAS